MMLISCCVLRSGACCLSTAPTMLLANVNKQLHLMQTTCVTQKNNFRVKSYQTKVLEPESAVQLLAGCKVLATPFYKLQLDHTRRRPVPVHASKRIFEIQVCCR